MAQGFIRSAPYQREISIGSTRFVSEQAGAGPPLILLHGLGGSTRWWARNWRTLAHHHEVHLLDLAGYGRSRGRFVLAEAAHTLALWMERVGLQQAHLLGHSLGGYVSLALAAMHPELIDRLILTGAALNVGPRGRQAARLPRARQRVFPFSMLPIVLPDALRAGLFSMAQVAKELIDSDMSLALERLQARTLLIWGEDDLAVPLSVGREIARRRPDVTLAIIEDAGHAPMWEQPFLFNRLVLDFLADRPISTAAYATENAPTLGETATAG